MERQTVLTEVPARVSTRVSSILPFPVTSRSIPTAIHVLYALLLALGLGLGSAYMVLQGDPPFGSLRVGPWQAWPKLGSSDADPYMRAIVARRSDIPLATGEGLVLAATKDSAGGRLDSACSYRIGSVTPAARLWTLTLYDQSGRLPVSELGRSSYTSSEVVRNADDGFAIILSRQISAGNWLQLPESGPFSLTLRLYDMPGAAGTNLQATDFPIIERLGCGS
jgi:hypothetical protein